MYFHVVYGGGRRRYGGAGRKSQMRKETCIAYFKEWLKAPIVDNPHIC